MFIAIKVSCNQKEPIRSPISHSKSVQRGNRKLTNYVLLIMISREVTIAQTEVRARIFLLFVKPKILSWNVRGLNERDKRLGIKESTQRMEGIICLQESKLEHLSRLVCSFWGCQHVDWCYLGVGGASRGILLMWDRRVVENLVECVGNFTVACSFRNVKINFKWAFPGFYRPNIDYERRLLWDELVGLLGWCNISWCIGGNSILSFSEQEIV
jgi:hypothetical protein